MNLEHKWMEFIDAFMAYIELERGLSRNCVLAYENDLKAAALFWQTELNLSGWSAVEANHVGLWIGSLTLEEYAAASLARKLSALRGLARYLVTQGVRKDDFTQTVQGPRLVRHLPETLSVDEVSKLIEAPNLATPQGLRDKAIFELMYSAGLRVSELTDLTLTSIDLEEGFVRVLGKGSKMRLVPVGSRAIKAIRNYLTTGRPLLVKAKTGGALFISQLGKPISRKTIWLFIKDYARKAGIVSPVKPHLLRHCFATHLLMNGADLRAIQEMLGHADICTTQIYTAVQTKHLEEQHDKYHPRISMSVLKEDVLKKLI
jgi:integrase/recombinase XerD